MINLGIALASLVLLGTLLGHPTHAQEQSPDDAQAAVRALIQRTEDANNAGDVDAWVALFADDAIYMPPNAPSVTTKAGLVEIARAGFRHQAAIHLEPLEIQVFGDWAFARIRVTGKVTLQGTGEVVPVDVKQIVIYRQGAGRAWRIARLISNSNLE